MRFKILNTICLFGFMAIFNYSMGYNVKRAEPVLNSNFLAPTKSFLNQAVAPFLAEQKKQEATQSLPTSTNNSENKKVDDIGSTTTTEKPLIVKPLKSGLVSDVSLQSKDIDFEKYSNLNSQVTFNLDPRQKSVTSVFVTQEGVTEHPISQKITQENGPKVKNIIQKHFEQKESLRQLTDITGNDTQTDENEDVTVVSNLEGHDSIESVESVESVENISSQEIQSSLSQRQNSISSQESVVADDNISQSNIIHNENGIGSSQHTQIPITVSAPNPTDSGSNINNQTQQVVTTVTISTVSNSGQPNSNATLINVQTSTENVTQPSATSIPFTPQNPPRPQRPWFANVFQPFFQPFANFLSNFRNRGSNNSRSGIETQGILGFSFLLLPLNSTNIDSANSSLTPEEQKILQNDIENFARIGQFNQTLWNTLLRANSESRTTNATPVNNTTAIQILFPLNRINITRTPQIFRRPQQQQQQQPQLATNRRPWRPNVNRVTVQSRTNDIGVNAEDPNTEQPLLEIESQSNGQENSEKTTRKYSTTNNNFESVESEGNKATVSFELDIPDPMYNLVKNLLNDEY